MGQAALAVAAADQGYGCSKTCRQCGDLDKEHNTVRVDLLALQIQEDPVRVPKRSPCSPNGAHCDAPCDVADIGDQEKLTSQEQEKMRVLEEARTKLVAEQQQYELEQELKLRRQLQEHHERRQLGEKKWQEVQAARVEGATELQRRENQKQQLMEEYLQREDRNERRKSRISEQQAQEDQRRRENLEKKQKIHEYLETHGFQDVKQIVRKKFSKVRPLHFAVQENDPEAVSLLLWAGADKHAVCGSKGETPIQLAQRLDTAGSHAAVLQILSKPSGTGGAAAAAA